MAFPSISAAATTSFATSVTTMAVNLPASISAGNLLIAVVQNRNNGTWTPPSGWSAIFSPVSSSGVGGFCVFYKIADGTEGSTATWTISAGDTASWQAFKVTSWHGTTPPEATTSNSAGSASVPNTPSLTPSWGADDTLWLSFVGATAERMSTTVSSNPTSYTGLSVSAVSAGGASVGTATSYRQVNSSSNDPSNYTWLTFLSADPRWWMGATIAIRPAGAVTQTSKLTLLGVG